MSNCDPLITEGGTTFMAVDLSIHTMILHHKIGFLEVETLCRKYGVAASTAISIPYENIRIAGVDSIFIKQSAFYKGSNRNNTYDLNVKVNAGRLIGDSQNLMLLWSKKNAERFKTRLQGILKNDFYLKDKNSNLDNGM